ncbi:hypothetical protein [Halpernia sp.]|uniref:hypothetical protein n=1 Tax=Halpernia sp. TaxID=2782209 RepID=UPI003A8D6767
MTTATAFAQQSAKKIGIIFNIDGPYKIYKQAMYGTGGTDRDVSKDDKFYDLIQFLGTEKANPLPRLEEFYINTLKEKGYEVVVLHDTIDAKNFSVFTATKKKIDFRQFKEKYDVDELMVVKGQYGLELEKVGAFNGDKRTNITFTNFWMDTNTNVLKKEFYVSKYQNITKKDMLNPPDYPNVTESMDILLNKKVFRSLKSQLEDY